jgi:Glycosyl hydrolases family 2, sugar binding domain
MNIICNALLPWLLALAFGYQYRETPEASTELPAPFSLSQQTRLSGKLLRTRYTINYGWKFLRSDESQAELPAYDDASWNSVIVPHTWNVEDTLDDTPGYYRGIGWYRRKLRLEPQLRGKRLFLYFEGANQIANVYVNGHHAGRHIGGYTAFAFEITDYVEFDRAQENMIAVKVDNSHSHTVQILLLREAPEEDAHFMTALQCDSHPTRECYPREQCRSRVWQLTLDQMHSLLMLPVLSGKPINRITREIGDMLEQRRSLPAPQGTC